MIFECILLTAILIVDTVALVYAILNTAKRSAEPECEAVSRLYAMSKEDYESFVKADQERVQDFTNALSNLNAFMTGMEDDANVGKQEI